jgi:ATP-binding cassette subfamily B protein
VLPFNRSPTGQGDPRSAKTPQQVSTDTALRCLFRLGIRRSIYIELDAFKRQRGLTDVIDIARLPSLAPSFGVNLEQRRLTWPELMAGGFSEPVMLVLDNGDAVLALGFQGRQDGEVNRLAVFDAVADDAGVLFVDQQQLESKWSGTALLATSMPGLTDKKAIGFSWFMSKIFAERRAIFDIFIAAVCVHVLAIGIPVYFQLLIDKVVPNAALTTLHVLAIGVAIIIAFDAIFGFVRSYLLAHIQRRIDFSISCETIQHLLSLPIGYFIETPAGVIGHTVHEATNVREFLTGRLANTILDLLGIILFLPFLAFYSWQLTVLVISFSAICFVILAFIAKKYRRQVEDRVRVEGRRQALLIELTHGISTIKTLALETGCSERWRRSSFDSADCGLAIARTSADARSILGSLEKLLMVSIGGVGALLVINDFMTVGALVAFNMLSMRVSSPLIQAGSLLQDFQKAATSLNILRVLLEREPEPQTGQLTPTLKGGLQFENVTFYYPGTDRPALQNVSFRVEPGQTIGIVGRSGSGKTTVTRLIQALYSPQTGLVGLDDQDVKEMNLAHLRSQIGMVLQDNFLFRGSVRENIAITKPHASFTEVIRAARLAGAHEFIQQMRHGYSTELEEGATNISGGQRQRLAIARALMTDPRILVFDEATSSLDPESEAIIQANLKVISKGRTMIIVSHRLSFVHNADQILVFENGMLSSAGRHELLLEKDPTYRTLWRQQARSFRAG